jgi:uncharacterized protein
MHNIVLQFTELGWLTIVSIVLAAFVAGLVDAVVGGGGLIQVPAMLIALPLTPIPTLLGTGKMAALAGTSIAAYRYAKRVQIYLPLLLVVIICAAVAAVIGANAISLINSNLLKPLILIILIAIAIYTFLKKDLGTTQSKQLSNKTQIVYGSLLGVVIGFYDGFFGPGTGSFLVLGFVVVLGFEFLQASAYAKVVNCTTNIGALIIFVSKGYYILPIALLMAISNIIGNIIGTRLAIKKGNQFIRVFFLAIVVLLIARYAYDVLINFK